MPDRIKIGDTDVTSAIGNKGGNKYDEYIDKVKAQAKQDAANGIYMSDSYHVLEKGYMAKHISPNRSKPVSYVASLLNSIRQPMSGSSILKLYGMPGTASVHKGIANTTAEIYDENGEMIAAYSNGGGWVSLSTKAETNFSSQSARVYLEAYRAAKAEIAAASEAANGTFSVRV